MKLSCFISHIKGFSWVSDYVTSRHSFLCELAVFATIAPFFFLQRICMNVDRVDGLMDIGGRGLLNASDYDDGYV